MQTTTTTSAPDNQNTMDECLLRCGNVLERLTGYKVNSDDINDVAELLASSLKEELLNGNLYNNVEPPPADDWQSCDRLQPDDATTNMYYTAGFDDCMDEAIRYLIEEENLGAEHPVVRNLKNHLEDVKERLSQNSVPCESDTDNNNFSRTPSVPSNLSYDCYMSLNFMDSSSICNFG